MNSEITYHTLDHIKDDEYFFTGTRQRRKILGVCRYNGGNLFTVSTEPLSFRPFEVRRLSRSEFLLYSKEKNIKHFLIFDSKTGTTQKIRMGDPCFRMYPMDENTTLQTFRYGKGLIWRKHPTFETDLESLEMQKEVYADGKYFGGRY